MHRTPSSEALARAAAMVPLSAAADAEARQRSYQRHLQGGAASAAQHTTSAERYEEERRLREQQDEEFLRTLEADRLRELARKQQAEANRAAQVCVCARLTCFPPLEPRTLHAILHPGLNFPGIKV